MNTIEVKNLVREFKMYGKKTRSFHLLKSLFERSGTVTRVVDHINFSIQEGEFVGYLGPNGAGKSTTIKMLSGILVPTSGTVNVMGLEPHKHRKRHAQQIGVVFGQRTQLWWDLPLIESFKLLGSIYNIPKERWKYNLDMFTEILGMENFLQTPVRQLSLGQRMRGDIAASLLHDPKLLFLDEPTIGLDLMAKERIQDFLKKVNVEKKLTIILTTHNLDDVEKLCKRVIFIDKGKVLFDGSSVEMVNRFGEHRYLIVETSNWNEIGWKGPRVERSEGNRLWFKIDDDAEVAVMVRKLSDVLDIHNLTVQEPKMEDIMRQLYARTEVSLPVEKHALV